MSSGDKCHYCKKDLGLSVRFVLRKATLSKGTPNRWRNIGNVCEKCESEGKPTQIKEA